MTLAESNGRMIDFLFFEGRTDRGKGDSSGEHGATPDESERVHVSTVVRGKGVWRIANFICRTMHTLCTVEVESASLGEIQRSLQLIDGVIDGFQGRHPMPAEDFFSRFEFLAGVAQ